MQIPVLHAGLPQIIAQANLQAIDCWRLRREKAERDAKSESSSEEDSDDDDDEDDLQELKDDEDADHSKYVKKLAKMQKELDGEEDDDDSDSDSDEDADDDARETALDAVDECLLLAETLKSLPPQFQQQVAATLGADMPRLQRTLEEVAANPTAKTVEMK